jgi:hypothetical protein
MIAVPAKGREHPGGDIVAVTRRMMTVLPLVVHLVLGKRMQMLN